MVSLEQLDEVVIWDTISDIISNKDESKVPQITSVLIRNLMSDMVTGGHNESYLIFLQAVTTNNVPGSVGLADLDLIAREDLSNEDDALAFANLFSFIHKQGQNPLALSFSELLMDLNEREKLAKVDERFREEWETSHNLLKVRINEEQHWVDRLRFLDPELKKIREAQTEIESLSEQLERKTETAEKAASIANQLLNIQIDDQRIIEYISKRTYNYFLISWSTPRRSSESEEDYETFGGVIDDWLKDRKEFYGLTVRLGNSTRVGKIPRGMTFEEFKRLIGRDLMNLRQTHGIEPQVFITCWSPSIHSAHALLGEETLQMDPITALRTTFRKGPLELANEPIDQFIEQSLFGQTSMIESIAALNLGAANPMSFWEKDPIEFMIKIAVLSDDTRAFFGNKKYKEKMAILYDTMKGSNSLEQLALNDGRTLAMSFVDDIFKGYHQPTRDVAIEAAGEMIDTLRIVLLLKTDR